jgi:PAS fold.
MTAKSQAKWLDISARELHREVGQLRPETFDQLPFGAIRLNREGLILGYNAAEAKFAQRDPAEVVGKHFFHDIAPCTRVQEFYGAFLEASWRGSFDHSFRFTFRFPFGWREARLRMFSDGTAGGIFVLVDPQGEARTVPLLDAERRNAS